MSSCEGQHETHLQHILLQCDVFLNGTEYSERKTRVGLDFIYQELIGSLKIRGLSDGSK